MLPETLKVLFAQESGGSFAQTLYGKAFKDADVVYPKSWAPLAVMQERTELLRIGNKQGLQELNSFVWPIMKGLLTGNDEEMMKLTKNGEALYEHCLPADISDVSCERGEVSQAYLKDTAIILIKKRVTNPS